MNLTGDRLPLEIATVVGKFPTFHQTKCKSTIASECDIIKLQTLPLASV
jgi:hypothetical protein